jgi:malto-oligosyltrehalose synthase/4-alpha-glucanotransferase
MYNPVSTYRIQFHKDFNFDDFKNIIPYLKTLGITTVYASPVFESTPGSTHGYDGLNPLKINPEIGTEMQLMEISQKLKQQRIGWLQDIVPNHMAFDVRNGWLMDVLEKGRLSKYSSFFDIDWNNPASKGRLMVPFLGASLEEAINNEELKIAYRNNRLFLEYYDSFYPLNLMSYLTILSKCDEHISENLQNLKGRILQLDKVDARGSFDAGWQNCFEEVSAAIQSIDVEDCLTKEKQEKSLLLQIANAQHYRLCHWQETDGRINYRRFFTVNGLICLNMQDKAVFDKFHTYIHALLKQGIFDGLRIDHIDGLYDPSFYLNQLRQLVGEQSYIIVEKILEPKEQIPDDWPIQGNTGYDFLAMVNNLLTNKNAEKDFSDFYNRLTQEYKEVEQQVREKKAHILYHNMGGELENLYQIFMQLVTREAYAAMRTEDIKAAIAEFLIHCPVYRFYGNAFPFDDQEAAAIKNILNSMRRTRPDLSPAIDLLASVLLIQSKEQTESQNEKILHFYKRCMQFSGPLMAKGVEDTLMYTYNRFIAHNEVGDSPEAFGFSIDEFHELMKERQSKWPLSLNATSTHDTKRGEDVRARLNVLSDLPQKWISKVEEWRQINAPRKTDSPDVNDEYFIYQTLIGSYPLIKEEEESYNSRLQEYVQKALREAKRHSNWTTPNEPYEEATKSFAASLVDKTNPFWKSFESFHRQVADFGIINSLVQLILKFTCPGVPDLYQGSELWDFSLVDPDNRRPIDYSIRQSWLKELSADNATDRLIELWNSRSDARIKLWLTHCLLKLRNRQQELFSHGAYKPLKSEGHYKNNVLAFARINAGSAIIVAVPLHIAQISIDQNRDVQKIDWKDTRIILPANISGNWTSLLVDNGGTGSKALEAQRIFSELPFCLIEMAVVENQPAEMQVNVNERNAGVLLHLTSLPSPFGIGDMGLEAKVFTDFLSHSGQSWWQMLPVNPTEAGQGHSPYSALSSRAGNTLLISPEVLASQGLLNRQALRKYYLKPDDRTDYDKAEQIKKDLFHQAWNNFKKAKDNLLHQKFNAFCLSEKEWLNDFALYSVLKKRHGGKPWYEWPDEFKFREEKAIQDLANESSDELSEVKWLQFIFLQQWQELKEYCNERGVFLIGDLPFYVSYDSVDVWSHPHFFSLDADGNRIGIAGVPPDAFSDDGQLWGMPVFRWEVLKENNYSWWIDRLKKNWQLFDLVRLDHFRAFADYWEVPANESTARNGQWKPGPGSDFFIKVREEMGELPFLAEDLGDINDKVIQLRDEFSLPGMKILQFAFGENYSSSDYIPHNYQPNFFAYTGTHDNNTVVGWFRTEADADTRARLEKYAGRPVTEEDVSSILCRMAMSSIAKTVIIPMQDILALDERARMNIPASGENNWNWRLLPGQSNEEVENRLKEWTELYNRLSIVWSSNVIEDMTL